MHPAEVLGLMLGDQALKKVCNAPARGGVLTFTRSKGPRDQRKESTVDERVPVDEKQPRTFWTIHEMNIKRLRLQGARRRFIMICATCCSYTSSCPSVAGES